MTTDQGDAPLTLLTEYTTPYNAIIRDDVVMGVPRYFLERWLPLLGPDAATVVNTLRQLDYRCHGDAILIGGEALAREAAMSRRHLYTCLEKPWMNAFVRHESGQRSRDNTGRIVQQANRYYVRMDDPLTPADADHLLMILPRLADTPLAAAQCALDMPARELWASDPLKRPERFTEPRAINAHDVLQRAFPTWIPRTDEQKQAFLRITEALHRHITLTREDGRTSKIIVPQYFRRRWWKHLGHELAWAYLWLRGQVFEKSEEGIWRDTCWVPSLNSLLTIIGRPREWWRRHVEIARPHPEGWALTQFFEQIDSQKGQNPQQPQWVARRFRVALDIPIAPADRELYAQLMANWPAQHGTTTPAAFGSFAIPAIEPMKVRHNQTHQEPQGLPQPDTPGTTGSATNEHTETQRVCHIETQGSGTSAHRESESLEQAPGKLGKSQSSTKHPANDLDNAVAEIPADENQEPLIDQLAKVLTQTPHTPLYLAVSVHTWLQQSWPEPIRPHTPIWTYATSGAISQREIVALILAVWADKSIKHPPRYLSWLAQRWRTLPNTPPVDRWDRWLALAEMPLGDWFTKGRDLWIELVPRDHRALPFGMDGLEFDLEEEETLDDLDLPLPLPDPREEMTANGLDERPAGGLLTIYDIWRAVVAQLSLQLQRVTYTTWVEGARAVAYADGVLTVRARHKLAGEWMAAHLNHSIEWSMSQLAQRPITVRYIADEDLSDSQ